MSKDVKEKPLTAWLQELENRHAREIQLGLTRIYSVAAKMNLLKTSATVITVAGTNGKGSVVAVLTAIYVAAGYKVGTYTSPHLVRFNERIKINNTPIPDDKLIEAFEIIDEARGSTALTYFEMVTLAALWYFQQTVLDLIILEVGMGGRLDATNIIDSDLAIITTIDYDHQEYLGETLEEIGREKAGILRPGRLFIGAASQIPQSILEQAQSLAVKSCLKDVDYSYQVLPGSLVVQYSEQEFCLPKISLHPDSVSSAVVASKLLSARLPLANVDIASVLQNMNFPGRLQLLPLLPCPILLDVAHNPQSACFLAQYIRDMAVEGDIHIIFSVLKDKNLAGVVEPLLPLANYWYPAKLESKRASSFAQLKSCLDPVTVQGDFDNPVYALDAACQQAKTGDLIVAFGSFLLVGAVLSSLDEFFPKEELL